VNKKLREIKKKLRILARSLRMATRTVLRMTESTLTQVDVSKLLERMQTEKHLNEIMDVLDHLDDLKEKLAKVEGSLKRKHGKLHAAEEWSRGTLAAVAAGILLLGVATGGVSMLASPGLVHASGAITFINSWFPIIQCTPPPCFIDCCCKRYKVSITGAMAIGTTTSLAMGAGVAVPTFVNRMKLKAVKQAISNAREQVKNMRAASSEVGGQLKDVENKLMVSSSELEANVNKKEMANTLRALDKSLEVILRS